MTIQIEGTNQEIFDKVVKHLAKQGQQCVDKHSGGCLYRNEQGLSCAVGCLIDNEHYRPGMEDKSVFFLVEEKVIEVDGFDSELLQSLQGAHDKSKTLEDLTESLEECAKRWGLNRSSIDLIERWL